MRDIKGYEGLYAVTSCGKVWSYRRKKFLKPRLNKGYEFVHLSKDGEQKCFFIHRLVAEAYIPNPDGLPQVNHKDEVKTHNWMRNLEWCTQKYNNNYGTRVDRITKKITKKVICIETGEVFNSIGDAANSVSRHHSSMSSCLCGRSATCAGLHWKYIKEGF